MNKSTNKGFHWGHGIIVTFVLFGAFMAYFYINMTQQVIELVGDNYYEDGQKFQQKIDLKNQKIPYYWFVYRKASRLRICNF